MCLRVTGQHGEVWINSRHSYSIATWMRVVTPTLQKALVSVKGLAPIAWRQG